MKMTTKIFGLWIAGALMAGCGGGEPDAAADAASETAPEATATAPVAGGSSLGQTVGVEGGAEYTDITVEELQTMMAAKNFPLINVHVPFQGDLPETDASIPFDEIASHLDMLPADKNAPIVLYCRSGNMSTTAAAELAKLGYTDVYNLVGGFRAWSEAGLPMVGG